MNLIYSAPLSIPTKGHSSTERLLSEFSVECIVRSEVGESRFTVALYTKIGIGSAAISSRSQKFGVKSLYKWGNIPISNFNIPTYFDYMIQPVMPV